MFAMTAIFLSDEQERRVKKLADEMKADVGCALSLIISSKMIDSGLSLWESIFEAKETKENDLCF